MYYDNLCILMIDMWFYQIHYANPRLQPLSSKEIARILSFDPAQIKDDEVIKAAQIFSGPDEAETVVDVSLNSLNLVTSLNELKISHQKMKEEKDELDAQLCEMREEHAAMKDKLNALSATRAKEVCIPDLYLEYTPPPPQKKKGGG